LCGLGVSFDNWGEIRPPIAKEKAYTARREKGEICGRNRLTRFVHFRSMWDVRGPQQRALPVWPLLFTSIAYASMPKQSECLE
jgi:hypothetical protein